MPDTPQEPMTGVATKPLVAAAAPTAHAPASPKRFRARIEHKVPGRIRMRVPQAKLDPKILETYAKIFAGVPGVLRVKTKPETACIVIHYDIGLEKEFGQSFQNNCDNHLAMSPAQELPGDEIGKLARRIEAEANFLAERSEFANTTVKLFRDFDRELKLATDNNIDLQILLAVGLAGFTFLEIGAAAATPMWVTLVLFTLNHFTELHAQDLGAPSPPAQKAPKDEKKAAKRARKVATLAIR